MFVGFRLESEAVQERALVYFSIKKGGDELKGEMQFLPGFFCVFMVLSITIASMAIG